MPLPIDSFNQSINMIDALLALESGYEEPSNASDTDAVNGLRGGALVLLVACFENYVKSHVAHFVTELNVHFISSNEYDFDKLPERIVVLHYFSNVEKFIKMGKVADRVVLAKKLYINTIAGKMDGDMFADTRANPNSANVKSIFNNINVENIFNAIREDFISSWGRREIDDFISEKLNEIVGKRHEVAHTARLSLSREDLKTYVRFIKIICASINSFLARHLNSLLASCIKDPITA